jgi:hypothetical protein
MVTVPICELPLPSMACGKGVPHVQNRSWNILDIKLHTGVRMRNWKVLMVRDGMEALSFKGPRDGRLIKPIKAFSSGCKNSGVDVSNEPPA